MRYSIRCRVDACRHRQRTKTHPDDMQAIPCPKCGAKKGFRLEGRAYNQRNLCSCDGPQLAQELGKSFPHNKTHPLCDHHPYGFYNQAKCKGISDEDIPIEYRPPGADQGVSGSAEHTAGSAAVCSTTHTTTEV